jgi:hypothetical protein
VRGLLLLDCVCSNTRATADLNKGPIHLVLWKSLGHGCGYSLTGSVDFLRLSGGEAAVKVEYGRDARGDQQLS